MSSKIASQIRLDETLYEKLKAIAEKEMRSMNSQMEYLLLKGVEQYERENGPTQIRDEE